METISASEFKATCLALLDRVYETGQPLLITKHGKVIAQVASPAGSNGAANGWAAAWGRAESWETLTCRQRMPGSGTFSIHGLLLDTQIWALANR